MSTPPMVELTRRRRVSEHLRNAQLFVLSLVLVIGLMSFVQIVLQPASPDDPVMADPVPGTSVDVEPKRGNPLAAPEPTKVTWPVTARETVRDGRTVDVGGLPVTVMGGDAVVSTADRDDVLAAGVSGTVVGITVDEPVDIVLDYSSFAAGYGGDWGTRATLYRLPDCGSGVTDECATTAEAVSVVNDTEARTLNATVSSGVFAVVAAASGSGGSFAATPLGISSQWTVGGPSGAFSWSYPMPSPATSAGPGPAVSFDYNSQTVDGRTGITNNQGSWIGEGFTFEPGYIERRYKPCVDDGHDGVGDQCWAFDNATIMLAGASGELVKDGTVWRSSTDDGATVERLTGAVNGDDNGEHWKVTTLDGTQYFFGMNRRPGWATGDVETGSVWTSPVFGDDAGEPCNASTFENSHCDQAWRWNLDYTVDPLGNVVSYVYGKETNHYALNADLTADGVKYTRGGYLKYIEYGQRESTLFDVPAPARVDFTVAERCLPTAGIDCDPADLTDATAMHWPDVPADQICDAGVPCEPFQVSPTFFTRKRLTAVTTQVYTASAYKPVDIWALNHTFVTNVDGTRTLWLDSIQRTGHTATTPVTLPPTELLPVQLENRVEVADDNLSALVRPRLATVYTDTGGQVEVTYSNMDCAAGDTPTPATNTRLCFPVIWQPSSQTEKLTDWFHKYVVTMVVVSDRVGGAPDQVTRYDYQGDPAWRKTEPDGITKDEFLTWRDWRGFGKVSSIMAPGKPGESRTDYVYFRGMHGDKTSSGGTRTVDLTDSTGAVHRDWDELSGRVLETIVYDGAGVLGSSITSYWRHVTATETRDWGDEVATFVRPSRTRSLTTLSTGAVQETRTDSTYETGHGRLTQVFDHGITTDVGDDTCTRTSYADNPGKRMYAYQSRTELVAVGCDVTPDRSVDVLDDTRTSYDGGVWGAAPTKGLQTRHEILKSHNGTTPTYLTVSTTEYDGYGRATRVVDADGVAATVAYVDVNGRSSTITAVNALGHTTTSILEPLRGLPFKQTDANGKVSEMAYDAVGRLSAVWPSFAPNALGRAPTYVFEYVNTENAPAAAISRFYDVAKHAYRLESIAIYDGWMRERQAQVPGPEGNRLVTDVIYDEQGRAAKTNDAYYVTGAPNPSTVIAVADDLVNGQMLSVYDSAGRITAEIVADAGEERWRTTYSYDGELTHKVPPQGEAAVTTVSDGLGQIIEQRRYHGRQLSGAYDSTQYEYDRGGMLSSVADAVGNVWSYEYDQQGRQIVARDPDAGDTTFVYDDLDRLVSTTDARGVTLSTSYDVLGRVKSTWEGQPEVGTKLTETVWDYNFKGYESGTYSYDDDFTLLSRIGSRDWDYRPTMMSYEVEGPAAGALAGIYRQEVDYNDDGTVKHQGLLSANGMPESMQTFDYDELRRPISIMGSRSWASSISYTATGLPSVIRLPMAGTTFEQTFSYEHGTNRLERMWLDRDDTGGTLSDVRFDYDDAGNILSIVDDATAPGSARDAQCFQYDHARQMTEAWTSAAAGVSSNEVCAGGPETTGVNGPAPYWNSYRFDATGNRSGVTTRSTAVPDSGVDHTYNYPTPGSPGAHQAQTVTSGSATMASYLYDEVGNTLSVDRAGSLQTIGWNAQGKVESISQGDEVVDFKYDAGGNEVLRTDSSGRTLYLPGMQLHEDTSGAVDWTQYVSLPGGTTAVVTEDGTQYQFADHNGTGQLGIDGTTGEVTHRYTDPYGNQRGTDPTSWKGEKGFVGGTVNAATGYTTIGARQYDPVTGKFLSVDPIIDYSDPEQLNPYTYSHGNPVTFSDPTGLRTDQGEGLGGKAAKPKSKTKTPAPTPDEVEEAQKTLNTSLTDVVIDIAGDMLLDFIGVNDLMSCVGDGDMWACVSLALDVVPWAKVFSVGKKLWKAADQIMSAVAGYDKVIGSAKKVIERAKAASKKAEDSPKKDVDDVAEPTPPKKPDDKPDKPKDEPANTDKAACNSFTAAAKVVMADGTAKPIADVEIGDEVLSSDPATGEVSTQLVTALPRTGDENNKVDRVMVDVTVDVDGHGKGDEVIESTAGHAFWTNLTEASNDGAKWVPARDLVSGAWLRTSSGTWVQATALTTETRPVNTYNLSVSQTHTYFVEAAAADVLVHNCEVKGHSELCKCDPDDPTSEVTLDFSSFEQARNYGLEFIGSIDLGSRSPLKGRLEAAVETFGKVVGFTGRSGGEFREFRLDFDPTKGPHINVMTGKKGTARKLALVWPGTSILPLLGKNT